jgi:hypothetical protein
MNGLWDIRIFLGLVPKESPCTWFLVRVVLGEGKAERTSMQDRSETNMQLWSVR